MRCFCFSAIVQGGDHIDRLIHRVALVADDRAVSDQHVPAARRVEAVFWSSCADKTALLSYQTKAGKAHDFNRGMKGRTLELLWEKFQNNFVYIHVFVTTWHLKYDIIDT